MTQDLKERFFRHVCQTSPFSTAFEVERAEGCYLWDRSGKRLLDFISGIAVTNVGHCHPRVVEAIVQQTARYAHTMVYGEHIQQAQVELAEAIAARAPVGLDTTYFLTTGSEANDAALKMAAKLTGRSHIIAFHRAYHGDTIGALACFGDDSFRAPFSSLLKPVTFLPFGSENSLNQITRETAAVVVEPIQGEAGIILPPPGFLTALRSRCTETGALLIFDEVQTGFGRCGAWFAAGLYDVVPDVITMAKGMGAGMPLAGLQANHEMLTRFAADPPFSHITTFGGHPVSCAAGLAGIEVIENEGLLQNAQVRGRQLIDEINTLLPKHDVLLRVRGEGLMIGVETTTPAVARKIVEHTRLLGLMLETTLLNEAVIRFSPPLIVTTEQCAEAIAVFARSLDYLERAGSFSLT